MTHINAYRQDVSDKVAEAKKALTAVEEAVDKLTTAQQEENQNVDESGESSDKAIIERTKGQSTPPEEDTKVNDGPVSSYSTKDEKSDSQPKQTDNTTTAGSQKESRTESKGNKSRL